MAIDRKSAPSHELCDWCRRPSRFLRPFALTPSGRVCPRLLCPSCHRRWSVRVDDAAEDRRLEAECQEELAWSIVDLYRTPATDGREKPN